MNLDINIIAAVDQNFAVGANGKMPWHIPEELAFFKKHTLGGVMLMGRVTYESIGKPLPGRISIVVSSQKRTTDIPNVHWVASIEDGLDLAYNRYMDRVLWVTGGSQIYNAVVPRASKILLSHLPFAIEGADAFFPRLDSRRWEHIDMPPVFSDNKLLFQPTLYSPHA